MKDGLVGGNMESKDLGQLLDQMIEQFEMEHGDKHDPDEYEAWRMNFINEWEEKLK